MRSSEPLPIVLIPGLLCTPLLYADQLSELWRIGPLTLAVHDRDDSLSALARRILSTAPQRFALAGLSMGGYISFEILRQAPERVAKLVLLDTNARPETPQQSEQRRLQIAMARDGRLAEVSEKLFPRWVHARRWGDESLKRIVRTMAQAVGAEGFVRQQTAIIGRPDSRPGLGAIRCPTLVVVGDSDVLVPAEHAQEMANGIRGARLVTIADSGHLSTLEQPAAVTKALVEFIGA